MLTAHAPDLGVDVVLADAAAVPDRARLERATKGLGAELVLADLAVGDGSPSTIRSSSPMPMRGFIAGA